MSEMAITADRLIVIGRGRLIAQTTIEDFLSCGGFVQARSPQAGTLAGLLQARGATVSRQSADTLRITGVDAGAVPLPRPLRAAMAAVAMWTIWIVAYVTGMSSLALTPHRAPAAEILGSAIDRQLATVVLWAAPAICLGPVVYYMLTTWLGERDTQEDKQPELTELGAAAARRPPSGWRDRGAR
ncbi:MAG: hypothetical protein ACRDOK_08310 [Streptosporangiaceae bacterium]